MTDDEYLLRGLPAAALQQSTEIMARMWQDADVDEQTALMARDGLSTELIAEGAEAIGKSRRWGAETAERDMRHTLAEEVRRAREWAHF